MPTPSYHPFRGGRALRRRAAASLLVLLAACGGDAGSESAEGADRPGGSDPAGESGGQATDELSSADLGRISVDDVRLNLPWTEGLINRAPRDTDTLRTVQRISAEAYGAFDRVMVVVNGSGTLVGYRLSRVDHVLTDCGAGPALDGPGPWAQLRLEPAGARDVTGASMVDAEVAAGLTQVQGLHLVCDRDDVVEWAVRLAGPGRHRVLELRRPLRLVVDFEH